MGGKGTLRVQAKAIRPERPVATAAPALRVGAVCAAVVVVAGLVPHETFKSPMIAMGKIHGIPPFKGEFGFCGVYIQKIRFMVKRI